jgi:hypothetical protein
MMLHYGIIGLFLKMAKYLRFVAMHDSALGLLIRNIYLRDNQRPTHFRRTILHRPKLNR